MLSAVNSVWWDQSIIKKNKKEWTSCGKNYYRSGNTQQRTTIKNNMN